MDYFESTAPFFVLKRSIKYYVSYAEDNLWSKKSQMPRILLVCDNEELRKKVEAQIVVVLDRTWKVVQAEVVRRALEVMAPTH